MQLYKTEVRAVCYLPQVNHYSWLALLLFLRAQRCSVGWPSAGNFRQDLTTPPATMLRQTTHQTRLSILKSPPALTWLTLELSYQRSLTLVSTCCSAITLNSSSCWFLGSFQKHASFTPCSYTIYPCNGLLKRTPLFFHNSFR